MSCGALWSLSSIVSSQIFHVVRCCGPRVEQPRPQIEMQPLRLFPWSLSQLHPLLCREEGSMRCAKTPGYRGGNLTCSLLWAKGWHLCSGLLSLPWPKHTPGKSLSLPSLLARKSGIPSCLWLDTVPRMMLLGPVPAKEASLLFPRYPFTSQGSRIQGQSRQ